MPAATAAGWRLLLGHQHSPPDPLPTTRCLAHLRAGGGRPRGHQAHQAHAARARDACCGRRKWATSRSGTGSHGCHLPTTCRHQPEQGNTHVATSQQLAARLVRPPHHITHHTTPHRTTPPQKQTAHHCPRRWRWEARVHVMSTSCTAGTHAGRAWTHLRRARAVAEDSSLVHSIGAPLEVLVGGV